MEFFWERVEKNLAQGRIRLLIASDELRPEVRRIIEFLNNETENLEILGLEIKCYGEKEDSFVLVPKIIGQLQATADKKASSTRTKLWSFEELKNYLSDMESHALGNRLLNIVDWAKLRGALKSLWRSWKTFVIKRVKVRGN